LSQCFNIKKNEIKNSEADATSQIYRISTKSSEIQLYKLILHGDRLICWYIGPTLGFC